MSRPTGPGPEYALFPAEQRADDLLAIDALTTYAFEHTCESGKPDAVRALASDGARAVSQLSSARG